MTKFIQSFSDTGRLVNKFGKRVTIEPMGKTFTHFPGFNPKLHVCEADSLDAAIEKFGLTPYTPPSKADVLKQLKAKRDSVQYGAFAYMGKKIQYDLNSRTNIAQAVRNAMIAIDEQWPSNFVWICEDNTLLPMTRLQVLGMDVAAGQYLAACFATYNLKVSQIEANESCDINSNWPE